MKKNNCGANIYRNKGADLSKCGWKPFRIDTPIELKFFPESKEVHANDVLIGYGELNEDKSILNVTYI